MPEQATTVRARRARPQPTAPNFGAIRPATSAEVASMTAWCRRRYEAGDAVIVSTVLSDDGTADVSFPARSPLTRARLAELHRQGYAVLTLTPARYPERAYQMVAAEWEEVEVMGAPEDARCDAAKEVLPTTHIGGLRRVAPDEFARLCQIGCGRVEVADVEAFAREWEEAFPPVSGEICPGCNGSGEGRTERLRCSTCGGSGEVDRANARLIAAAPDLLRACEHVRAEYAEAIRDMHMSGYDAHELKATLKVLDAALAKVRGEEAAR